VVSVLDSGAEGPGFKSLPGNSLRQTVHTHRASVHQAAKLVAAVLRVAAVTVGLAESNDSLPSPTCLCAVANYPACICCCCCRCMLMEAIEDTSLADSITRRRAALSCLPNEYDTIACPLSDRRRVFLVATSRELIIARFHYTGPTGPARTFLRPGSPRNSVGSVRVFDKFVRVRVVEFSL